MTRTKKHFIVIWSVIGAIVICILIALPLAYVFKPTIPTDEFLPEPDAILCRYQGKSITLSDEQRDALYDTISQALSRAKETHRHKYDPIERFWEISRGKYAYIEFRYHSRHTSADGEAFDRALLFLDDGYLSVVRTSVPGKYIFGSEKARIIWFWGGYYDIKEAVYELTA